MNDKIDSRIEGYEAYINGADESKNPYDVNDNKYFAWNDGWQEARSTDQDFYAEESERMEP